MQVPLHPMLLGRVVAVSATMTEVLHRINQFAQARTTVVLVGETGTGKSFCARLLHQLSGRSGRLAEITAAELDGGLAHDQLFGHARGSFTGAMQRRLGLFADAGDGTLLLDDFHLLARAEQALLLRAFDRGAYRSVGTDRDVPLTCRLVIGVGRQLDALVADGTMLPDLRYRLGHCVVRLPRLEERREEIGILAQRFLEQCPADTDVKDGPRRFARDVVAVLEAGHYPGNLRDLRERIRAAYLLGRGSEVLEIEHLPDSARASLRYERRADHTTQLGVVQWALWRTGDHVGKAAELIGASRNTVAALRAELRRMQERSGVPAAEAGGTQAERAAAS